MNEMTKEEKDDLVRKVWDLCASDVLTREDMVEILEICRSACERRISEVSKTGGDVQ